MVLRLAKHGSSLHCHGRVQAFLLEASIIPMVASLALSIAFLTAVAVIVMLVPSAISFTHPSCGSDVSPGRKAAKRCTRNGRKRGVVVVTMISLEVMSGSKVIGKMVDVRTRERLKVHGTVLILWKQSGTRWQKLVAQLSQ
jgi:hypothetical protein